MPHTEVTRYLQNAVIHTSEPSVSGALSQRETVLGRFSGQFNEFGVATTDASRMASLQLYGMALGQFVACLRHPDAPISLIPQSIGGSIVSGEPRLGIVPVDTPYEDVVRSQTTALKKALDNESVLPSDIDVQIAFAQGQVLSPYWRDIAYELVNALRELIFREYGVFIHAWIPPKQLENSVSYNQIENNGGLTQSVMNRLGLQNV